MSVDPVKYKDFILSLDLDSVVLTDVLLKRGDTPTSYPLRMSVAESCSRLDTPEGALAFAVVFYWDANESAGEKEVAVAHISATYAIHIRTSGEPDEDCVQQYEKNMPYMTAWPYFRELIGSMVGRMDLPSLTLPMRKLLPPSHKPKTAAKKTAAKKTAAKKTAAKKTAAKK